MRVKLLCATASSCKNFRAERRLCNSIDDKPAYLTQLDSIDIVNLIVTWSKASCGEKNCSKLWMYDISDIISSSSIIIHHHLHHHSSFIIISSFALSSSRLPPAFFRAMLSPSVFQLFLALVNVPAKF
jgi:hypothetical protein